MLGLLLKLLLALIVGSVLGVYSILIREGCKMAIAPFKLWEDMKRWNKEVILKHRLSPDPNVSITASLQRDLSSVMADDEIPEAKKAQLFGQTLHKFK